MTVPRDTIKDQYCVLSAAFVISASMRIFTYKKPMILRLLVIVTCVLDVLPFWSVVFATYRPTT